MSTNAATLLTQLLEQYGVTHVFGIPGVHTLELYRGLESTSIRHVTPRHEQGAGFMADGYARVSAKPGVCFIISGPGMTNIITAMGQAYSESVPMLVISTVNPHGRMGSGDGWLHELSNQAALISPVCAFSHTIHDAQELPQILARAFAVFDSQRPRPVHIEIPINVLSQSCENLKGSEPNPIRLLPPSGNSSLIREAAKILGDASKSVMLIGGGTRHASQSMVQLAEALMAPVVMTVNARGVLPHDHPLAVSASASLETIRALLDEADVVLGIGTEMGPTDYDFNDDGLLKLPEMFIRIDIDAQQLLRNHRPQLGIIGDAASTGAALLNELENGQDTSNSSAISQEKWGESRALMAVSHTRKKLSARDQIYLQTLETIRDALDDVVLVGDSTQLVYAGNCAMGMSRPASYFNSAMGFGTLGYALPAAIGAAIADSNRRIVAISGDGGLQFCLAELATAVDENLRLTLIVHENGGYHEIDKYMLANGIQPIGVKLMVPDLPAIAAACGWQCKRLTALDKLESLLQESVGSTNCSSAPQLIVIDDILFNEAVDALM